MLFDRKVRVSATQVLAETMINGQKAQPGDWVVFDSLGNVTIQTDENFRKEYEQTQRDCRYPLITHYPMITNSQTVMRLL